MLAPRSELSRWVEAALGAYLALVFSPLGPSEWRNTPSLRWLHAALPWSLLLLLLIAYTLLIAVGSVWSYLAGSALGAALYGWEFVALLATLRPDAPSNPFVFAAMVLAILSHGRQVSLGAREVAAQ